MRVFWVLLVIGMVISGSIIIPKIIYRRGYENGYVDAKVGWMLVDGGIYAAWAEQQLWPDAQPLGPDEK